ncbi:hypothetical protein COY26_03955 [Candidatus Woesearchaeota archaeon CG_4_10_14_0_2_um_filter_33_10]|nr:MAG: hypothetical protein COY26_03955 [Candidatus Woesearchaeota archaeon CG_4_10_14_0_2_um_filter_33_10]
MLKQYLKGPDDFADALKSLVDYLEQERGFSHDEIIRLVSKEKKPKAVEIPACIFNKKLSSLESVVKYLKENLNLKYSEIAKLLNRNDRTIWTTYSNSRKKFSKKFVVMDNKYFIPALIISNRSLSVLGSIVSYFKDNFNLKYSQIALLLCRDQRTIWTVYNRRKKKNNPIFGGKNE